MNAFNLISTRVHGLIFAAALVTTGGLLGGIDALAMHSQQVAQDGGAQTQMAQHAAPKAQRAG